MYNIMVRVLRKKAWRLLLKTEEILEEISYYNTRIDAINIQREKLHEQAEYYHDRKEELLDRLTAHKIVEMKESGKIDYLWVLNTRKDGSSQGMAKHKYQAAFAKERGLYDFGYIGDTGQLYLAIFDLEKNFEKVHAGLVELLPYFIPHNMFHLLEKDGVQIAVHGDYVEWPNRLHLVYYPDHAASDPYELRNGRTVLRTSTNLIEILEWTREHLKTYGPDKE